MGIKELMDAAETGKLEEAFGLGTAAVISPIGELYFEGKTVTVSNFKTGPLTQKIYDELTAIQWGRKPDPFGWVVPV